MFGASVSFDQGGASLLNEATISSQSAIRRRTPRLAINADDDKEEDRGYQPPNREAANGSQSQPQRRFTSLTASPPPSPKRTFTSLPPYRGPIVAGSPLLTHTDDADDRSNLTFLSQVLLYIRAIPTHLIYYMRHALLEMRKRKFNYILGTFSCFLVVCVAAICYTLIARAPVVFLSQAEGEAGQIDAQMDVSNIADSRFLNYTQFAENTKFKETLTYHTPRFSVDATVYGIGCTNFALNHSLSLSNVDWAYVGNSNVVNSTFCNVFNDNCIRYVCPTVVTRDQARLFIVDTNRERRIGVGRLYESPAPPIGHAVIHKDAATRRSLRVGDTFFVSFHLFDHLYTLLDTGLDTSAGVDFYDSNSTMLLRNMITRFDRVHVPVVVSEIVSSWNGKFTGATSETYLMEYNTFLSHIKQHLHPNLKLTNISEMSYVLNTQRYLNFTYKLNPFPFSLLDYMNKSPLTMYEMCTNIIINLPPSRIDYYMNTDYDTIQDNIVNWAAQVRYYSSFPETSMNLPVLEQIYSLRFFSLFLGLILSIILTILFILSTMLIYSLLMISIETRTFELGVHRMVGMTRPSIIAMLLTQACSYSIPAWVLGLVVSQVVAAVVCWYLEVTVEVPVNRLLSGYSIAVASFLGLFIPLIAAILPIRTALGRNLHDAIDTSHSQTVGVAFNIERAENNAIESSWLVVGFGFLIFGFLIYYLLPLSLLSFNLASIFNIFFGILLGMLFGLILLALNLQPMLERFLLYLFFFWEYRQIPFLVEKNLIAHRVRNRKTSIMYALSLGFIIFITVAYQIQILSLRYRQLQNNGAEMAINFRYNHYIPMSGVKVIEDVLALHRDTVSDWTWVSNRLHNAENEWDETYTSNIGHAYAADIAIYAVTPNFYDVADNAFLVVSQDDSSNGLEFSEQIYTIPGSQSAIVGTSLKAVVGVRSLNDSFLINLEKNTPYALQIERIRAAAIFDLSPRFGLSRFPTVRLQNAIVSIPTFIRMSGGRYKSVNDMTWAYMLIKFTSNANNAAKDRLKADLQQAVLPYESSVYDSRDILATLARSDGVMSIIFASTTYIAMGLCLFSLMASMYTNIYEQSKEIAILRAMGLPSLQLIRVYTYEAFILVFAASMLGVFIGALIGWTMSAQQQLFTQLPVEMEFPWTLLILVSVGSVVCALVASVMPARTLMQKKIATIMRTVL